MACGWDKVDLGATGLKSSAIGLASSFGIGASDVERAFERGINYFYFGSIRRGDFGQGLARLAPRHRSDMIVVVQSYTRVASLMGWSLDRGLKKAGIEYADFLLLGWWNDLPPRRILDAALKLRDQGKVRHLMISGHQRTSFPKFVDEPSIDAVMVRYNAGHSGAETEVYPQLGSQRPVGSIAYTATRWGTLLEAKNTPAGDPTPRPSDCYRFVLTNPSVHVVMAGPKDTAQMNEALAALDRGAMTDDELAWMKRVGARARRKRGWVFGA